MFLARVLAVFLAIIIATRAAVLPEDEVEALRQIGGTLGKTDWDFDVDPCGGNLTGWISENNAIAGFNNSVICDCSFVNKTVCHVTHIILKSQSLPGTLPPQIVKLPFLQHLDLTRNYLSGPIPSKWGSSNLLELSVLGNRLTGSIPEEIGNITTLISLVLEMNRLSGSLPPALGNLSSLNRLILSSNNFSGELPPSLERLTSLMDLDLSFNRISGQIPTDFEALNKVDNIYLTGNLLNGSVPTWMLQQGESIDLSYNKFTWENAQNTSCQSRNLNLFASSLQDHTSGAIVSCLASSACNQTWYSLHINCGGKEELINGMTKFEADTNSGKSSLFFQGGVNWAFSNTGNFMDDDRLTDDFIAIAASPILRTIPELYTTARISPISLTYYAYCMGNGKYTVNLHFAEIAFTNDITFNSFGRRVFDVYIQGEQVLKDFNIADAAGGIGVPFIKNFTVYVTHGTLEIHLYWAGRGTSGLPFRGVYGPLISAISVDSDSETPSKMPSEGKNIISAGVVVGIVATVAFVVFLVLGILWWRGCLRKKGTLEQGCPFRWHRSCSEATFFKIKAGKS